MERELKTHGISKFKDRFTWCGRPISFYAFYGDTYLLTSKRYNEITCKQCLKHKRKEAKS